MPAAGVLVGTALWSTSAILIASDRLQWGTVAEWFSAVGAILFGTLAAVFAALAWHETKQATEASEQSAHWAAVATDAGQRANYLFEVSRLVEPKLWIYRHDPDDALSTNISIELSTASDPIWIQDIILWFGVFIAANPDNEYEIIAEALDVEHRPFDLHLDTPWPLRPNQFPIVEARDPFRSAHQGRYLKEEESFVYASIRYSFVADAGYDASTAPHGDPENAYYTVHEITQNVDLSGISRRWTR